MFIVGGAAMALAYSNRRITKDIDAVFEPKAMIYESAAKVAEQLGLPDDWRRPGSGTLERRSSWFSAFTRTVIRRLKTRLFLEELLGPSAR